jgi:hypothetical protein
MGARLTYAVISAFFGALVGLAGWWFYGLGMSVHMRIGHGIDPVLRHWLVYTSAGFGVVGFILRERAADVVGEVIGAIFHTETVYQRLPWTALFTLAFLATVIAAVAFTAPHQAEV